MSSPQDGFSAGGADASNPNAGKKAVHVKWAGKTIALGTFPSAEADEKCARAKALTRAWRSTMRPKPSRDWVMLELERLGVRVVSGRLGRKAGEDDDGEPQKPVDMRPGGGPPAVDRKNSMGWPSNPDLDQLMQQRRSSSLGLSMLNDDLNRRSSLSSLGPALALDGGSMGGDPSMPPHRPLVGGGAAAAYEAARADHYAQKREEQQRRASSLGLGGMGGGASMPQMGLSVNPNQHYEMLKLHHMNLLNEIQETTLMMNLYQQQQLQQQQQQLQQQQANEGASDMAMLLQHQGGGMDGMFGSVGMGHRGSLGMGAVSSSDVTMVRQQQLLQQSVGLGGGAPPSAGPTSVPKKAGRVTPKSSGSSGVSAGDDKVKEDILKGQEEQRALEEKLKKLKDDIAKRQKEAEALERIAKESSDEYKQSGQKRKADKSDENESKKAKDEDPDDTDEDDENENSEKV